MTTWHTWIAQPQQLWIRKALFQIHLWTGIATGTYILVICLTGSLAVYANELYLAATPKPIVVEPAGNRLTDDQLTRAALGVYQGYHVTGLFHPRNSNQAVDIWLERRGDRKKRLFHPYTGADLGTSVPLAIRLVSALIDLHDNLLAGPVGRRINGVGGLLTMVLGVTGLVIWWPGVQSWRRSLIVRRHVGWKRFNWDLHSAIGIWGLLFVILFGVTGAYLGLPALFSDLADLLQPPTEENAGMRLVDVAMSWLARLHFGRFGGQTTKLVWAVAGLAPAALFVTGTIMWWNRVLSPRLERIASPRAADSDELRETGH